MGIGIKLGGRVRAGVSTRGAHVGIGPLSAGSSWGGKRRSRRSSSDDAMRVLSLVIVLIFGAGYGIYKAWQSHPFWVLGVGLGIPSLLILLRLIVRHRLRAADEKYKLDSAYLEDWRKIQASYRPPSRSPAPQSHRPISSNEPPPASITPKWVQENLLVYVPSDIPYAMESLGRCGWSKRQLQQVCRWLPQICLDEMQARTPGLCRYLKLG
jgi:hypothetical protein